jgi:hypothetical protein
MLDLSRYEYRALDLPNVKVQVSLDDKEENAKYIVDFFFKEFLAKAAVRYPTREFICFNYYKNSENEWRLSRFFVFENREPVGQVWLGQNGAHEPVIVLKNERIQEQRQRGESAKTKDINKAVKLLGKFFGSKTLTERINEAQENCAGSLNSAFRDKKHGFYSQYNVMVEKMAGYLMNDWEKTKEAATTRGVDAELLERMPGRYEDYMVVSKVYKQFQEDKGVVVVINGNDYAVSNRKSMQVYSSEDLPDWIKRGVGMLKLIEPGNVIGGVGYKISADSFYVMVGGQ